MGKDPFGDPDGARTDITEVLGEFISFSKSGQIMKSLKSTDSRTRVVVGAKGSGKTMYLRRLQAYLKDNESIYVQKNLLQNEGVYVREIEQELPTTSLIVKFGQCYSESDITEKWMYLWKLAIFRSLVSNLLTNTKWNSGVTEIEKTMLREYFNVLYPKYKVPMSIYDELRNILVSYDSRKGFDMYIERREWDELAYILGTILKKMPPIYFFIDSIDEEYAHAPMYWLRCQKGLFYRVMRFVRDANFGNKLHVIISIRDSVMASICESEHQTRYINEDHIHILHWDYTAIQSFWDYKIKQLDDDYFLKQGQGKDIQRWLGISKIYNIHRGIFEPIEQYLIRHTRLIPRDVVIMGNSLAKVVSDVKKNTTYDIESLIRKCVSDCARTFGRELLINCANQIVNNEMPGSAARYEYSEVYTSAKDYVESTAIILRDILKNIKSDRFTMNELEMIEKKSKMKLGENNQMIDILWQNGVIGYMEPNPNGDETEMFFNNEYPDFLLPREKRTYFFRSCMIDALGLDIQNLHQKPIIGC